MIGNLPGSGEDATSYVTPSAGPDFDRLNQAERQALRLLAEGHTAKSIAALTGRTVAAVNERLREARRKTGIGSSRELARLLKAQKNRDEQIGIDSAPGAEPTTQFEAAPGTPGIGRMTVMISFVIAAVAATAIFTHGTAPTTAPASSQIASPAERDALLGGMFQPPDHHPRRLYDLVRSESPNPAWARRAEPAIRARYSHLLKEGRVRDLRMICGSTICELAGIIVRKGDENINPTMQDIQDNERDKPLNDLAIARQAAGFGNAPGSDHPVFVTYWMRSKQ